MSNQHFFKIVCFHFPVNILQKIEYICFLFKIHNRCSLSDFKVFGQKAIGLFSFQIIFESTKSSVLFLEICEQNPNVLVLFLSFWMLQFL
jgi:hypothetical protein